ncbi:MAG TPA: FAD-binding oxidoreductase [Gaiellaceae bacterium]|nr:FAD-binding oxidoreductase [Gaiellaceae bacterium]
MAQAPLRERRVAGELGSADAVVVGAGLAGCAAARLLAEAGEQVLVVERAGVGAGASGRNGGFLFRQPAAWINDLLAEAVAFYRALDEEGEIPLDLRAWPLLLLAAEEGELPRARAYAAAVGGVEADLRADAWLADDLAGGFLVDGCFTVDAMSATAAAAEAARRAGARFVLGCEAKRILLAGGRVAGLATDLGIVRCGRIVVAAGPRLRFLLRTAGADLPVSASRGWLLETGPVEPPPVYAIEQAAWPEQAEMGAGSVDATLGEIGTDAAEEPALVSLLLGGRPAGHCLIGTSLSRSLLEEPEGPETIRRLAERAVRIAPHLERVPVVASWSGRRAMTPDGLPVVGPAGGIEGLEVIGGLSSIGMITGPGLARRLAARDPGPFMAERLA